MDTTPRCGMFKMVRQQGIVSLDSSLSGLRLRLKNYLEASKKTQKFVLGEFH